MKNSKNLGLIGLVGSAFALIISLVLAMGGVIMSTSKGRVLLAKIKK